MTSLVLESFDCLCDYRHEVPFCVIDDDAPLPTPPFEDARPCPKCHEMVSFSRFIRIKVRPLV